MADFFGNLFGAITGQKTLAPYQSLSLQDSINQAIPFAANANIRYNDIMQPALARQGLESSAIVNPYANQLEQATTKSILDQLNLGGNLPDEVAAQVQRSALQSGIASGLGISPAGRAVVARDLGLTGLDLLNKRIANAAAFTPQAVNMADRFFRPVESFTPNEIAAGLQGQNDMENQRSAQAFYNDKSNFINLLNTGGRVLGGVAGGIFGGPMGAQMGMNIGGSLINNPYAGQSNGGGGFANLLNSQQGLGLLNSVFGQKYGNGSGGFLGTSIGANPYDKGADMFG